MQRPLNVAVSIGILLLGAAVSPEALANESKFWAGVHGANLNDLGSGGLWGPGAAVGGLYQFDDFWSVALDAGSSYHFENVDEELPAEWVNAFGLSLRYNLDVFTYIPWLGLGATFYLDEPQVSDAEMQANFGAKLALGIDWRYSRENSLGFYAEIHALGSDLNRYPIYSCVGLSWNWHFRH